MVGKTTIIREILAKDGGVPACHVIENRRDRQVVGVCESLELGFWTSPGSMVDIEITYREGLRFSDAQIFVVDSTRPNEHCSSDSFDCWEALLAVAQSLSLTWDDIPWLLIINKCDLDGSNPSLPPQVSVSIPILRICAIDGEVDGIVDWCQNVLR